MSERLAEVRSQLGGARLIVVTKYADEAQVEALLALGVRDFGENRAKQLEARRTRWPEASWHFLGRIQRRDIRHLARRPQVLTPSTGRRSLSDGSSMTVHPSTSR